MVMKNTLQNLVGTKFAGGNEVCLHREEPASHREGLDPHREGPVSHREEGQYSSGNHKDEGREEKIN